MALRKTTDTVIVSERVCWALSCSAASNSELNCLVIQTGHAACLQFCWHSKLQEQWQVWSDVLIDCLRREIQAQWLPKQGDPQGKIREWIWAEGKLPLAYSYMETGIWDVQIRQCAHTRYQTYCSTRLGNNQWIQAQTVLGCEKSRTGHVIGQTAIAEISIYGVKNQRQPVLEISLFVNLLLFWGK